MHSPAFPGEFSGKVVGITDGDTIKVMHEGKSERVRLSGIDSPERRQAFGTKRKEFTSALCFGKTVRVDLCVTGSSI